MTKQGLGKWSFSNILNKQDKIVNSREKHGETITMLKV